MRRLLVVLVVLAHAAAVEAQTRTVTFVFQNNFWLNLHQFVRGEAYRRSVKAMPGLDPATLNDADRATWTAAVDAYADFAKRDVLFDDELRALNNALVPMRDVVQLPEGVVSAAATKTLNAAGPVYRAHTWPARQQDNDAWIARARALVEQHGAAMSAALARAYRITWPDEPVLVDAVGEIGPNSAITHDGLSGFAAHTQAGAASVRNTGEAPGDLWHFMMMYTSGVVAKRELASAGRSYQTYGERYPGMMPSVRAAFEPDWLPYVEGKTPFEQALHDLVRDAR
jgi:hypothetical protein